jgi:hypothetical protein
MSDTRTREQAVKELRQCSRCSRWVTTLECDSCWVDNHRCPPTIERAVALCNRAVEIGEEAKRIAAKLKI